MSTSITLSNSDELNNLLYAIDDLSRVDIRAERVGQNVTVTFDDEQIRAAVDKAARGEFLNRNDEAILKFNRLVTKFESSIVLSESERAANLERSKLARMEAELSRIRNQRGMTADMLARYENAITAQREKVAALVSGE